jgi:hypothetical protein
LKEEEAALGGGDDEPAPVKVVSLAALFLVFVFFFVCLQVVKEIVKTGAKAVASPAVKTTSAANTAAVKTASGPLGAAKAVAGPVKVRRQLQG